ncbi:TPA: hypothetical protein ACNAKF_002672, partial [Escherichia coli]
PCVFGVMCRTCLLRFSAQIFTYLQNFGIILPVQITVVIPQRIRWPKKTILKCKVPFLKRCLIPCSA